MAINAEMLRSIVWTLVFGQSFALAVVFFGLSWLRPNPLVDLSGTGARVLTLRRLGTWGSAFLVLVAIACNATFMVLSMTGVRPGINPTWGYRVAGLVALTLVLLWVVWKIHTEPRSHAGIEPRRSWTQATPRPVLWIGAVVSVLIVATTVWLASYPSEPQPVTALLDDQKVITESAPGWMIGVGVLEHFPTLIALVLCIATAVWALNLNAKSQVQGAQTRTVRRVTAQIGGLIVLGGLFISLGAVWAHVWTPTTWAVYIDDPEMGRVIFQGDYLRDAVLVIRQLGWVVQAAGLALLARLAVDTVRAGRRADKEHFVGEARSVQEPQQTAEATQ